ncbi:hypothetical protein OS31_45140 [Dickeya oryzae]
MPHRDTVIDRDGVEFFGNATGRFNLLGDQFAQITQMNVPGDELGERVHYRDDWLAEIGIGHPCRAPQGSRSSHVTTMRGGG